MPASMPQPVSAGPIAEPITIKEVAHASASMQLSEITYALRILLDKGEPVKGLIIWTYLSPVMGSILNFL